MASDLFGLEGKVAVVTGSTRGIGLAAARLMAEAGARIVLSSRKPEACEQTLADFKAAGHQAIAVPAHVAREEDRQRLISETMKAFGRIDIMVPNAAVNPVFSTLQDMSEDVWRKIMDTNLTAGWRLGQLA
ncbi:MAG: SDR family NAD(P)-dependent oxidoreductase, partial [Hyphomonadaceae bacterium]